MISRRLLLVLVAILAVLLVSCTVVVGAYFVSTGTNDAPAASVFRSLAIACLMLIVIDLVLLVGALGINAAGREGD